MSIVKKTRKRAGEYFLKKEFENLVRNKSAVNFEEAETIALIFDATDKDEFEIVKKYIKKLNFFVYFVVILVNNSELSRTWKFTQTST